MLLGRLEPGQTVSLDGKESCDYPVSYSYAAAQMVTGADQYEKAEIEDSDYLKAQERTRLLSFYLDSGAGAIRLRRAWWHFQPGSSRARKISWRMRVHFGKDFAW